MLRKPPCLIALLLLIGTSIGIVWYLAALRRGIISAYYEWGITEIICAHAEDNDGKLPKTWSDLESYRICSKHFNDEQSLETAKQHVEIKFENLHNLKDGKIRTLPPNTIVLLRGLNVHWINSKSVLERYILQNELPDGVWKKKDYERFMLEQSH